MSGMGIFRGAQESKDQSVISLLDEAGQVIFRREKMALEDLETLKFQVEFNRWDKSIMGENSMSDMVLYVNILCKDDHEPVDDIRFERWEEEIQDHIRNNVSKFPSGLKKWIDEEYYPCVTLNGKRRW
jgi:hypothetical protein